MKIPPAIFILLLVVQAHHVRFHGILHSERVKIEKISKRPALTDDQANPGMQEECPRNYRHRQAVPAG
jgi:hypothetical protein